MLIDARSLSAGGELECDVCVVGSGPAGIALADRLRNSGLAVTLLESGGFDYELPTQRLYQGDIVGQPYYRLDACRWRMFGGGSNRWGGWCRPLDPMDYAKRDWIPQSGWPITAETLRPYEEDAARLFELPSARFDLAAWHGRLPPPLVPDNLQFENVVFQHSPETNFGEVYLERLTAAPNITTVLHANVTELRLDADSRRVRQVHAATLAGKRFTVHPKAVVLAAGGIENARLLLASRADRPAGLGNEFDMVGRCFMEHLHVPLGHVFTAEGAVNNDFYRKAIMHDVRLRGVLAATAAGQSLHRLLATSIAFEGPSFSLGTPFVGWPPTLMLAPVRLYRGLKKAGLDRVSVGFKQFAHGLYSVRNRLTSWQRSSSARRKTPGRADRCIYSLYFRAEQGPDPANRVVLSEQRDALGIPRSRLEWSLKPADAASIMAWLGILKQDLEQRAIGTVVAPSDDWQDGVTGGPHHMGTTRMSADPRAGVVDADCRVHSVGNLYIAGSSVFATSGHANPTFTIVTLALRLADTLRKRLQSA